MPLLAGTCPSCGGNIKVNSEERAGICEFCGKPFVVEDAINVYNTVNNYRIDNLNAQSVSIGNNVEEQIESIRMKFKIAREEMAQNKDEIWAHMRLYNEAETDLYNLVKNNFANKTIRSFQIEMIAEDVIDAINSSKQYGNTSMECYMWGSHPLGQLENAMKVIEDDPYYSETVEKVNWIFDELYEFASSGNARGDILPYVLEFLDGNCGKKYESIIGKRKISQLRTGDSIQFGNTIISYVYINSDTSRYRFERADLKDELAKNTKSKSIIGRIKDIMSNN